MRVLVAVDASTRSEALVSEVAARPWPAGTLITVLNVLDVEDFLSSANYRENIRENENKAAGSLVQNIARRLESPNVKTFTKVIENYPATGIIELREGMGSGSHSCGLPRTCGPGQVPARKRRPGCCS